MEREAILKMEAGSELDRLVAEKVMGWTDVREEEVGRLGWISMGNPPDYPKAMRQSIGLYSTDIAAAWKVRNWLVRQGWEPAIYDSGATHSHYTKTGDTRAVLVSLFRKAPRIDAGADGIDGAPLAICRAALLAVFAASVKTDR